MNGKKKRPAIIGVYDGEHCGSFHIEPALRCMQLRYELFSDEDVLKPGFGEGFSLVLFGAGHVSESRTALGGAVGRQRIRNLIHDGMDYMGICAGTHLALFDEPRGLGLARHELDYPQTANLFQGFLTVEWSGDSVARFPVWYQNGPVFSRANGGVVARFTGQQLPASAGCSPTALLALPYSTVTPDLDPHLVCDAGSDTRSACR